MCAWQGRDVTRIAVAEEKRGLTEAVAMFVRKLPVPVSLNWEAWKPGEERKGEPPERNDYHQGDAYFPQDAFGVQAKVLKQKRYFDKAR